MACSFPDLHGNINQLMPVSTAREQKVIHNRRGMKETRRQSEAGDMPTPTMLQA
jgi:hypothetical protein